MSSLDMVNIFMRSFVRWRSSLVFLGIFIFGFILRVRDILTDDLWYDEVYTGITLRSPLDVFFKVLREDSHPPLYYLVTKLWTLVFGVSDLSLRAFSLAFGMLTLLVVYVIVKHVFSYKAALLVTFLASINPFLVQYSIEARSYSFYGFLTVLAVYFLMVDKRNWFIFTIVCLMITHYLAYLYIPLLGVYYIWNIWRAGYKLKSELIRLAILIIIFLVLMGFSSKGIFGSSGSWWTENITFGTFVKNIVYYTFGVKARMPGRVEALEFVIPSGVSSAWHSIWFWNGTGRFSYSYESWHGLLGAMLNTQSIGSVIFYVYLIGNLIFFGKLLFQKFVVTKSNKLPQVQTIAIYLLSLALTLLPILSVAGVELLFQKKLYVPRYLFPSSIYFIITFGVLISDALSMVVYGTWNIIAETGSKKFNMLLNVFVLGLLLVYCLLLSMLQKPNYNHGMRELVPLLKNFEGELIFTSPIDYTTALYYFGDNDSRLRLYDPNNLGDTYPGWWFIRGDSHPQDLTTSILVVPDFAQLPAQFIKISPQMYGNYVIYKYIP